ncbi:hypothetical protein ACN47E_004947 [Coniothyrium glycines]
MLTGDSFGSSHRVHADEFVDVLIDCHVPIMLHQVQDRLNKTMGKSTCPPCTSYRPGRFSRTFNPGRTQADVLSSNLTMHNNRYRLARPGSLHVGPLYRRDGQHWYLNSQV